MNKQDADKYIFEYLDKIFGFSLDKMKNIEQAQELASDIVYQANAYQIPICVSS